MRKMIAWHITITMANITRILIGQILVESATSSNIQELHSTADSKRGNVLLQRPGGEGQFDFIKLRIRHFKIWIRVFAVAMGLHIPSTREQEPIQARKQRIKRVKILKQGNEYGDSACML